MMGYFCDKYEKDLTHHEGCIGCAYLEAEFDEHICCKHIKAKHNPALNVALPKGFKKKL